MPALTAQDLAAFNERQRVLAEIDETIRQRETRRNRRAFAPRDDGMSLSELEAMEAPGAVDFDAQARKDKAELDRLEEVLDGPAKGDLEELLDLNRKES